MRPIVAFLVVFLLAAVVILLFPKKTEDTEKPKEEKEPESGPPEWPRHVATARTEDVAVLISEAKGWGRRYGYPWQWLVMLAELESNFNKAAIGDAGRSFGLFQFQEATADWIMAHSGPVEGWKTTVTGATELAARYIAILVDAGVESGREVNQIWVCGIAGYESGCRDDIRDFRWRNLETYYGLS